MGDQVEKFESHGLSWHNVSVFVDLIKRSKVQATRTNRTGSWGAVSYAYIYLNLYQRQKVASQSLVVLDRQFLFEARLVKEVRYTTLYHAKVPR